MNIALVQSEIYDFDIKRNLENLSHISDSVNSDTDLIIFPEMFLTGFITDTESALQSKQEGLQFMQTLARQKQCAVEGSLLAEDNGKYYNRHYFVTPSDVYYYDKQKLFSLSDEPKTISCGSKDTTVSYKEWKINLKTCYDLRFCDICKNSYLNGEFKYDISVFVASWPQSRSVQWKTLLQARAIENMCVCIGVNRTGKDSKGIEYGQNCFVFNCKGGEIKALPHSTENILYFTLDKEELNLMRSKFPVYKDW
ncbi:MAG: nitrilase family protein [Bacteroidales bacterium]|nr:nitrilase family protein [Bacteroidales bacterium]